MKSKIFVGLFVTCLVITSATTVHGQALTPPSWVPQQVTGWNVAYNNYTVGLLDVGGNNVKSNWTQIWFKNTSSVIEGVVGVVSFEYNDNYFGKAVPNAIKTALAYGYSGLPAFTGNTVWDLFEWMMKLVADGMGTTITDEKANIAGADGAFSLNMTGSLNFYLLYAYRNTFAMMIFAMTVDQQVDDWAQSENFGAMNLFMGDFVSLLVSAFSSIMTMMTYIAGIDPSLGAAPAVADIVPTGDITPTAGGATSEQDVNNFANSYVQLFPGGIPGYPVALIGIASLFAVLVIVQKKRKAIVA